nr:DUF3106 domain-containing protein [uncultured Massilia sp.]
MTANKRKVAGSVAVIVLAGAAAFAVGRYGGLASHSSGDGAVASAAADPAGRSRDGAGKERDKLAWKSLTPAQQATLQPLQAEWNRMDGTRRAKWVELTKRFATMKPEERQRVTERMRAWVKLTPEQRELARETYMKARKIAPEQKNATWQNYQQLSDDQKRQLAATAGRKPADTHPEAKPAPPVIKGLTSCPVGTVRNTVSATPPCVAAPVPPAPPVQPVVPLPPPPPIQEKPAVPANWGITPNNA